MGAKNVKTTDVYQRVTEVEIVCLLILQNFETVSYLVLNIMCVCVCRRTHALIAVYEKISNAFEKISKRARGVKSKDPYRETIWNFYKWYTFLIRGERP